MYEWLIKRKYYKVDLLQGIDYIENDIDEAKQSAIQDKIKKEKHKIFLGDFCLDTKCIKEKLNIIMLL